MKREHKALAWVGNARQKTGQHMMTPIVSDVPTNARQQNTRRVAKQRHRHPAARPPAPGKPVHRPRSRVMTTQSTTKPAAESQAAANRTEAVTRARQLGLIP